MSAGSVVLYSQAVLKMGQASFNLGTDTFQAALLTSSYTPAPNTDATWANVSTYEVAAGGGYTAGGITLTSQSWTTTGGTGTFTAANISWASSTITAKYVVIVRKAGGSLASSDLLLCYDDLNSGGGSVSTTSGTFAITWNAGGIFTATHTP